MKRKIFFRADGNSNMGLGHVVRSCSLADMLKGEFECHFFIRNPSSVQREQILKSCVKVHALPQLDSFVEEAELLARQLTGEEILVLDGYNFKTEYQAIIKGTGCKLVCIDDIHSYHFLADIIINHAGGIFPSDYSTKPFTQLYLGTAYALLRSNFLEESRKRTASTGDEIFICMGGADINNDVIDVLSFLQTRHIHSKCNVILGSAYNHNEALQEFLQKSNLHVEVIRNASAREIISVMKKCRYAICPPSTIAYEYLSVGGGLYLKQTADNQTDTLAFFLKEGMAFKLSEFGKIDKEKVYKSHQIQASFFDGRSDIRLQKIFGRLHNEYSLQIRRAGINDLNRYYEWVSDPEVRMVALNTSPVSLSTHTNWFNTKLSDRNTFMYVLCKGQEEIGQVRFDLVEGENSAVISYSIDRKFRNQGLGAAVLKIASEQFVRDLKENIILTAIVRIENVASNNVFRALGFQLERESMINGARCNSYSCSVKC